MFKNKKVLIVEDNFTHYHIYKTLLKNNTFFPSSNSSGNQSFITDVLSYIITNGSDDIGDILRNNIEEGLDGLPDYAIMDLRLQRNADDDSGSFFTNKFVKQYFPNCRVIYSSAYISSFSKSGDDIWVPKYENGAEPESIKKTILKYLEIAYGNQ